MEAGPQQAVIEFHDGTPDRLEQVAAEYPDEVQVLRVSGFNAADPSLVGVFVVLTPAVLKAIVAVVRAHIDARKHVTVKVDGIELTGLGGKDALEVLRELGQARSE